MSSSALEPSCAVDSPLDPLRAKISIERVGEHRVVIAIDFAPATASAPDELVSIARCGIELKAVKRAIRVGDLPATRLGRIIYVRRSDLLRLVDLHPLSVCATPVAPEADEYARIVQISKAKRGGAR